MKNLQLLSLISNFSSLQSKHCKGLNRYLQSTKFGAYLYIYKQNSGRIYSLHLGITYFIHMIILAGSDILLIRLLWKQDKYGKRFSYSVDCFEGLCLIASI